MAELGAHDLVLAGKATDACVTATARESKDLGYRVSVAADACATFAGASSDGQVYSAELVHEVSLATLAASGIDVCSTSNLIEQIAAWKTQVSRSRSGAARFTPGAGYPVATGGTGFPGSAGGDFWKVIRTRRRKRYTEAGT